MSNWLWFLNWSQYIEQTSFSDGKTITITLCPLYSEMMVIAVLWQAAKRNTFAMSFFDTRLGEF